jgi:phage terminase large subunit GpA-like protein
LLTLLKKALGQLNKDELDYIEGEIDRLPKGSLDVDVVQWATNNRVLPSELTNLPGPFDWSLVPHLIEPAMELSPSSPVRRVIVCKGVQIGATTGLIENFIGYTVDHDPCGLMYAREEKDAAQNAMDLQVDSMLELSGLKERVFMTSQQSGSSGSKSVDRALFKRFPGGFIYGIGVNNAKKMRSNPMRKLLRDEVDAWNATTIGKEKGDPMELTEKRTVTFKHTKKILDISTPLMMHDSRIYPALLKSDHRKRFVPCPFCGEYQELVWYDKENDTGFRYEAPEGILQRGSTHYRCRYCEKGKKHGITENYKARIMQAGEYRATNPRPELYLTAGFQIPSWYSLFESWDDITVDWLKTITDRDRLERLKEFFNLRMAEPFEDVESSPKAEMLKHKQRNYLPGIVPNSIAIKDGNGPILVLTCSVDVHKKKTSSEGRLDVEVLGHCRNGATYSIMWTRLKGDTEAYWFKQHSAAYQADDAALKENTWYRLEHDILNSVYLADNVDEGGAAYQIHLTGIDMSYEGFMVQTFCKQFGGMVIPLRGIDKYRNMPGTFKEKDGDHGQYFDVIVDLYKDRLAEYMALKWKGPGHEQPPGHMNYPYGGEYTKEYFEEYGGEHKVNQHDERTGRFKGTYWTRKHSKVPNHAWDCRVYNMALLDIFIWRICQAGKVDGINYDYVFNALEKKIGYKGD